MKRREIAREEWQQFFDSFNGQHEGWLVGVDRFDEFLDESVETRHLDGALRGVQRRAGPSSASMEPAWLSRTKYSSRARSGDWSASGHARHDSLKPKVVRNGLRVHSRPNGFRPQDFVGHGVRSHGV